VLKTIKVIFSAIISKIDFRSDSRQIHVRKKTVRIDYSTFNYPSKISTTKTIRIPSPE